MVLRRMRSGLADGNPSKVHRNTLENNDRDFHMEEALGIWH
jgi:hypothetical protein